MGEWIVYVNGEYVGESEARISIYDRSFLLGDAVFEVGRTFNRVPFRLREHIDRLFRSLRYTKIDPHMTPEEMYDITLELLRRNDENLVPGHDHWFWQIVSRGLITPAGYGLSAATDPTVVLFERPLPFRAYAKMYRDGSHLVTVPIKHVPSVCLDPRVKHHSRMHFVMAELEAKAVDPNAYPLILDLNGFLTEGSSFNIFVVKRGKLFTPRGTDVLEGITRAAILELAKELGIESYEADLTPYDLYNADEIIMTATSFTLLAVNKVDKRPLTGPIPGPVTERLLSAFNKLVGVDIVQQALSVEGRSVRS